MLREMICDLLVSRELSMQLAIRDIRAQYRQAALGLLWAFILPLAHTITWIFLSGTGIVTVRDTDLPYPIFVFTGTIIWAIFLDAVNAPLQQTIAAKEMLAKINFPREALVVSGIYQTLFNGVIKIVLLLATLVFLGVELKWTLIGFPFAILSLILSGTVLGLLLTPIGVLYADIGKSLPLLMQFLMYLAPVVFPMPQDGLALTVYKLNPITPLLQTARDWLTGSAAEFLNGFFVVNAAAVALLLVVWVIYRAAMPILIERVSA
jgi:lipopolysaccharide transport system permease protein